jgi:hypothetical protein
MDLGDRRNPHHPMGGEPPHSGKTRTPSALPLPGLRQHGGPGLGSFKAHTKSVVLLTGLSKSEARVDVPLLVSDSRHGAVTAMASPELGGGDGSYDFHLRSLSAASRDSAAASDPASDPNLLQSVSASPLQDAGVRFARRLMRVLLIRAPLACEGEEGMRDVRRGEGGEGRDGGAGVPGDEQVVPALRRGADAVRGLRRPTAACKTFFGLLT